MVQPDTPPHEPHFVIGESNDPGTVESLQDLEAAIYATPATVLHKVETLDTDVFNGEVSEDLLAKQVALAIDKETELVFDDVTEDVIATSGIMVQLQKKRKDNQNNETLAITLAAEVRRTRLAMFVQQVLKYKEQPATVVSMPERERQFPHAENNLSA